MGDGNGQSRWVRRAGAGGLGLAALVGGVGWAGSEMVRARALSQVRPGPAPGPSVRVEEVVDDGLLLTQSMGAPRDLESPLTLGVEGRSGYGQLVGIAERAGPAARRRYVHLCGERPGRHDELLIDLSAFPDSKQAVGVAAQPLDIETELGPVRALHLPGHRNEWAILVHGRIAMPYREPLRMLRPFVHRGHPALIVSYRNAAGAHKAQGGISRFGLDEWTDISAAITTARSRGARSVILGGLSMGGGIAMAATERHDDRFEIAGLVLDSPVLDLWSTIDAGAGRILRGGPILRRGLLGCTKPIARTRFGLDWGALDHTQRADSLSAPTLLIHGSADRVSPVEVSDALAAARPDLVTYRRTPGIDHLRSWNASPASYEEAVTSFLEQISP